MKGFGLESYVFWIVAAATFAGVALAKPEVYPAEVGPDGIIESPNDLADGPRLAPPVRTERKVERALPRQVKTTKIAAPSQPQTSPPLKAEALQNAPKKVLPAPSEDVRVVRARMKNLERDKAILLSEIERLKNRSTPRATQSVPFPKGDYDPVPSDQIDGVASRLQVVSKLITKFGRAYDYRVHTTRELLDIYKRLEASETSVQ